MFNVVGVTADVLDFSEDENSFLVDPELNQIFLTDLGDDDLDRLDMALLGGPFESKAEARDHVETWLGEGIIGGSSEPSDCMPGFFEYVPNDQRWYLGSMNAEDGVVQFIGIIEA